MRLWFEVARRSFRRWSTYRMATAAGVVTNTVFGYLRAYILLAVVAASGGGELRGWDATTYVTYAFITQALLAGIAAFGDALMRAGFRDPVLDREVEVHRHVDMAGLMRGLRELGATNALAARRRALTGRGRFAAAQAAYEQWRGEDGRLPATWETITAMAWAPEHGQPIREGGAEVARFPATGIPVRRRNRSA